MMLFYLATVLAVNPVGPSVILEPFEARFVVREVLLKIFDRVFFHGNYLPCLYLPTVMVSYYVPTVKG